MPAIKKTQSIKYDYEEGPVGKLNKVKSELDKIKDKSSKEYVSLSLELESLNSSIITDPLGGWVKVKYLNAGKKELLKSETIPSELKGNSKGDIEQSYDYNPISIREGTAKAYIEDWGNFYFEAPTEEKPKGKPLNCTKENIVLFSAEDGFMDWLTGKIKETEAHYNPIKEKEGPN